MRSKTKEEARQQSDSSGSGRKTGSHPGDHKQSGGGREASSGGRTKGGGQPGGGQSGGQGGRGEKQR